jgi:hypothetical protein
MSISARIPVDGNEKYFPLVTADTFKRFWLPGANALSLHWVKQFDACQLRPDNRVAICDELRQLKKWFHQTQPPDVAMALSESIEEVLPAIESLAGEVDFSIWIG